MNNKLMIALGLCMSLVLLAAYTDVTQRRGNQIVLKGVFITSHTVNGSDADITPMISSTTQSETSKLDWGFNADKNGSDLYISSFGAMNTLTSIGDGGYDCVKIYPGSSESPDGKNSAAVFGRCKAGTTDSTTVWMRVPIGQ